MVHPPASKRPSLQLNPSLGPPGTLVTVTGRGFPRDRLVRILVVGFDGVRGDQDELERPIDHYSHDLGP